MKTNHGIVATAPGAIKAEVGGAHVHPTQASGRKEHMRQADIIHDDKVMSEGAELNMYETRTVRRMYRMRRLFARSPSTSLGVLDKDTECDFEAIGRDACNTAGAGPCELPTLNGY